MIELFNRKALARHLGLQPSCLEAWAHRGGGPAYIKVGRAVRYRPEDVEAWLQARRFQHTGCAAETEGGEK